MARFLATWVVCTAVIFVGVTAGLSWFPAFLLSVAAGALFEYVVFA